MILSNKIHPIYLIFFLVQLKNMLNFDPAFSFYWLGENKRYKTGFKAALLWNIQFWSQ